MPFLWGQGEMSAIWLDKVLREDVDKCLNLDKGEIAFSDKEELSKLED
jgi:hypothetical protein